ncbi:hypothetical protein C8034_v011431 [Colletotrichum sidae]|uniref:C2H2-type domain-containing protein n=1 Tax=Colletotrichum sidae TaxID=1347389 RepID=A0A4R8TJ52_9PEZI|nr:hypothetical protein C8034_v011431 [Colletotrichum sidae]
MSDSANSKKPPIAVGPAKSKLPPHKAVRCNNCGDLYDNQTALLEHKLWAMRIRGDHIHCTICFMEFESMVTQQAHMLEVSLPWSNRWDAYLTSKQMHPQEQNLNCPGCKKRFIRLAGLMHHLEHNECPFISRSDVDQMRAQKLKFTHELEKRSGAQFGDYFPVSHPSVQSAMNVISKPYMANPSFFRPSDFPEPKAAEGAPEQEQGSENSDPAPKVVDINNPHHPGFSAEKYYNIYLRKYKCPQKPCGKSFSTGQALITHMKSSIAHYNVKLQCPSCLRWFKDASALVAHAESQSTRCSIRHSENFRIFMDQLTGGVADVTGKNPDSTPKYEVSNEALIKYASPEPAKKTTEESDTQDSERQGNAIRHAVW